MEWDLYVYQKSQTNLFSKRIKCHFNRIVITMVKIGIQGNGRLGRVEKGHLVSPCQWVNGNDK